MRPAGVLQHVSHSTDELEARSTDVSKKLIGDLKMAKAILSWSFLDA